jgi:hypothetical protein
MITLPNYYEDPNVSKSIESLMGVGGQLTSGNIPDYYKPIGEIGGSEYQDMVKAVMKNVGTQVEENLARRNISGGGISGRLTAEAMGDTLADLGYKDYSRALTGRLNLLNTGTNALSTAGSLALNKSGMLNEFNLGVGGLDLRDQQLALEREKFEYEQGQDDGFGWQDILSAGIGAAGNIYGMNMLGAALTATGKKGG